ncbi:MAG TPA: twin-arginine translocase subunit TatC, partial [Actinomycetota bacterium]|nr:twin-arginine translocase subunit TatC [Actinomycetota bacterium]
MAEDEEEPKVDGEQEPGTGVDGEEEPAAETEQKPKRTRRRLNPFARRRAKKLGKTTMSVVGHLTELRSRLVKAALAFVLISIVVFIFYGPISDFILQPLCDNEQIAERVEITEGECGLYSLKPTGGFNFRLKLTALVGIGLSSPIWLYQIYAFIVPALTKKERNYALPFLLSAVVLFLVGASLAYLTLPTGLNVLFELGGDAIQPLIGAEEYLDFIGFLFLGFGIMFEMPLLLVFLGMAGVITTQQLRKQRRLAIVLIFVLAAVVTPSQDPYTMSALAIPLYAL